MFNRDADSSFMPEFSHANFQRQKDSGYGLLKGDDRNGRIGLAMYRERPTDLVITDLFMPEMNGLDVVLELTREFLDTKVIAITGQRGKKDLLQVAKLLGARQILHKPLSMEKLLRAVSYELAH